MTALDRHWSTARVTFHRVGQRRPSRGLWATWLDDRLVWWCHVAGEGMRPRSFCIARQGFWRHRLTETAWMPLYRIRIVRPGLWDGRPDECLVPAAPGDQLDLFGDGFSWSGGVGVCPGGEAAGTPPTPPAPVYGLVTPIVSPTSGTKRSFRGCV